MLKEHWLPQGAIKTSITISMLMTSAHLPYAMALRILKSRNYGERAQQDRTRTVKDSHITEATYNIPWWLVRPYIQIGAPSISEVATVKRILLSRQDAGAAIWLPVIIACFTGTIPRQCGIWIPAQQQHFRAPEQDAGWE